ncbi:VOC family protein [Flavihumibacter solisilvae]|uniref:Bleomycin resistance protein n=1 Tax=Flavihumibacter solisilvae TaxID=1349421 RepID=A0A0C1IUC8_9BACT|nr:VOC family protein [Flavihumibacter solisilvae]KIC94079.1 bleomycin resistance protein [Flavihumibacter solisilvae]
MSSSNNHLLQGIDTVIVRVSDVAASKEWYEQKLGLEAIWHDDQIRLAVMDTKSPTSLTLWQTDKVISNDRETASYPIFKTPDAGALRKELIGREIEVGEIIKDAFVTYFFFYDPDGNQLEACQVHDV